MVIPTPVRTLAWESPMVWYNLKEYYCARFRTPVAGASAASWEI